MKILKFLTFKEHSPPVVIVTLLKTKTTIMKSLLTIFAALFFISNSNAQLDKTTWLVGGGGNFSAFKRDYTSYVAPSSSGYSKDLQFSASANIGYFLVDKFALGLKPYISFGKGEFFTNGSSSPSSTGRSSRYGVGPFARFYFLDKEKQFNILTEASYQFGTWNENGKGKLSNFSVYAGPVVYFNTSVGLEFLLGYTKQSEELKNFSKNSPSGFFTSIGLQIHLIK